MVSKTRRARRLLFALGAFLVMVAIYLLFPDADARPYAAAGCGGFGALMIATAIFTSDRVVERVEQLVTGWP